VIDFDTILTTLDNNLPMIPGRPEVVQGDTHPYKKDKDGTEKLIRITFGKLMPKDKKDKDEKKPAKKAKAA